MKSKHSLALQGVSFLIYGINFLFALVFVDCTISNLFTIVYVTVTK